MIQLAFRSLVRHKSRLILTILAISSSCALVFDMFMLANGFQKSLTSVLENSGYQLRLIPKGANPLSGSLIQQANKIVQTIRKFPSVENAFPLSLGILPVSYQKGKVQFIEAFGFSGKFKNPPFYKILSGENLSEKAVSEKSNEIIISRGFARKEKLSPGDLVKIYPFSRGFSLIKKPKTFRISAVAFFNLEGTGEKMAALSLKTLETLQGNLSRDPANVILVKVDPAENIKEVSFLIKKRFPNLRIYNIPEFVDAIAKPVFPLDAVSLVMRVVASCMVFLFLFIFLALTVQESKGELAGLKSIGFQSTSCFLIVFLQGFLLTLSGTMIGIPFGYFLAQYLNHIFQGFPFVPEQLHFFILTPSSLIFTLITLFLVGSAAGFIPAFQASRSNLLQILHEELE